MSAQVNLKITPETFDTVSDCLRMEAERLQNHIEDLPDDHTDPDNMEAWRLLAGRQQQVFMAARDIGRPITVKGQVQ